MQTRAQTRGRGRAPVPVVLTVAGSDSGGGAGIQADLKTFEALGVFGTSAVTCLTAQNPDAVTAVDPVTPGMVERQVAAVTDAFPVAAVKTGMLYNAHIILTVADALRRRRVPCLVVDPVMLSTSGARLLREDAVAALCTALLPGATVMTPNVDEAEVLAGRRIRTLDGLKQAARALAERFGTACVCKGGHLRGSGAPGMLYDVLYAGGRWHVFALREVAARETHGTGCTYAAAMAAWLARGVALPEAARRAGQFVRRALAGARPAGTHAPLGWSRAGR